MNLKLNVEQLASKVAACADFQIAGRLVSVQGLITTTLPAAIGELCQIVTSRKHVLAEVIGFSNGYSQIMPLETASGLSPGDRVIGLGREMTIPVGDALLGRVLDARGQAIDGGGQIAASSWVPIQKASPDPLTRETIRECLVTGQRALDGLLTIGRGQRIGLFAGSGVGKSTLLGEIAKNAQSDINVVALVGERGREVRPFLEESLGREGLARSIVLVSTADQAPLLRIRAAQTAVTLADWYRRQGAHVLFMLDSLTRLASAQRELGLSLGEPPSARGFPPSSFQLLANLIEQLGNAGQGSITGVLTVLVDGDDVSEPVTDAARGMLDGHIVLTRDLAEKGHFPAIDIGGSISRLFGSITSPEQQAHAKAIREILKTHQEVEDLIRIGAYKQGSSPQIDRAVQLKPLADAFLQQATDHAYPIDQSLQEMGQLARLWQSGIPTLA